MTNEVILVDYGVGNLLSVARALEECDARVVVTDDAAKIKQAERVVLPGVGAFGDCIAELRRRDLVEPILEFANTGRPMLGICVGMQVLMEMGEEFGEHEAFGLIPGRVQPIENTKADGTPHKIPHIGWTALDLPEGRESWKGTILEGIEPGQTCYFVHSYTANPTNTENMLVVSDYNGRRIMAGVQASNVFGTQFHPEKSGKVGLKIVSRFLAM